MAMFIKMRFPIQGVVGRKIAAQIKRKAQKTRKDSCDNHNRLMAAVAVTAGRLSPAAKNATKVCEKRRCRKHVQTRETRSWPRPACSPGCFRSTRYYNSIAGNGDSFCNTPCHSGFLSFRPQHAGRNCSYIS